MNIESGQQSNVLLGMVVPCFNEAKRLDPEYWDHIINSNNNVAWCFVDDGSTDNTVEILRSVKGPFKVVTLESNSGKGEAVRQGLHSILEEFQDIPYLGYIDSDMAFAKMEVIDFCQGGIQTFESKPELDSIIGSRIKLAGAQICRSEGRHLLARTVATLIGLFWKEMPYDTQCGLKLFRSRGAIQNCLSKPFVTRWMFDIEIFMRIESTKSSPISIVEIPLQYWKEIGSSKINAKEKIRIFLEILQILKIIRVNSAQKEIA